MECSTPTPMEKSLKTVDGWCVYLLHCADGTYYTGVTTDLKRRLRQHNGDLVGGARYTASRRPVRLAWVEVAKDRACAQQREHAVRRLSRAAKQRLGSDWQQMIEALDVG